MTSLIEPPIRLRESALRALTRAEFHQLAAVPAEAEWFANLDHPRTRRAYRVDLQDFMGFAGIQRPDEFRIVTRAHVLAWRKVLEVRALSARRSGASSPHCRRCSNTCAKRTPLQRSLAHRPNYGAPRC